MATMRSREHTAPRALQSLLGQFDAIHLVLNGYTEVPAWANLPGVNALPTGESRDYGAAGKLLGLSLESHLNEVIYYSVDDDIQYPRNFATRLAGLLEKRNGAMVGVHGSVISQPFQSWQRDRKVFSAHRSLIKSRQVDVIATCACAFLPGKLPVDPENWPDEYRNCVDLYFANLAAQHGIERWIIARCKGWLKPIEISQADSIFVSMHSDDSKHVALAKSLLSYSCA